MSIDSPSSPRIDSRGLPEGFDPHRLYEYRIERAAKDATGIEGFIYHYIPWSIIRSFAIAIDPFYDFKVSSVPITPQNRSRTRLRVAATGVQSTYRFTYHSHGGTIPNWMGHPGANGPVKDEPPQTFQLPQTWGGYQKVTETANDTTKRTRLMGSKFGLFDMMSLQILSTPRVFREYAYQFTRYSGTPGPGGTGEFGYDNVLYFKNDSISGTEGPAASYPESSQSTLRNKEQLHADALIAKHAVSMFKDIRPLHRNYSLFRNVVELKDLPRGILQLQETLKNLKALDRSIKSVPKEIRRFLTAGSTSLKDIPKEYLSYHFGWKQTFNDVMDLLVKPAKISKQINFLLTRSGKPTTYRLKRQYLSSDETIPGLIYTPLVNEHDTVVSTTHSRSSELRMVVNSTFDFPTLNVADFKSKLFLQKLGAYPTFTDLYNLTPWTWLVDWFTGLGNYIEIIDEINKDPSLINWGFVTCESKGTVQTACRWRVENTRQDIFDGPPVYTVLNRWYTHTSQVEYTSRFRKDLSSVMDVSTTADPTSLSLYQQSILGALLATRTNFRRT